MSIWFALWFSLSFILVVFLVWTAFIMLNQKKTWKQFAAKHKLRHKMGAFFASPEVSGVYQDYTISIFGSEHDNQDGRSMRKLSAIEVMLKSKMPMKASVGAGDMVNLIRGLDYHDEIKPAIKGWRDDFIAVSENQYAFSHYLNEERLKAMLPLMTKKRFMFILIFNTSDALIRLDTPEPLDNMEQLEKLVDGLVKMAKRLELKEGEANLMMSQKKLSPLHTRPKEGEESPLQVEVKIELELEEDDEPQSESKPKKEA